LEGLEASEVKLETLFQNQTSIRMDAEFYKKEFVYDEILYDKLNAQPLAKLTNKIDVGFVGSMVDEYTRSGVFLLQTNNINEFFINKAEQKFISESFHYELKKSKVVYEDILIARSGSFGKASIYLDHEVINSSDIIIVEANKELVNAYFLTTFLNSKLGVNQLIKFSSGGLQGHVNLTILENLRVPLPSDPFQHKIEDILKTSYNKRQQALTLYASAEDILLQELGLANWQPTIKNNNTKSLKASFLQNGRIDAEYYQPKYDELLALLSNVKTKPLEKIVSVKKSIEPGSDAYKTEGLPFIRVADLSKNGISESAVYLDELEFGNEGLYPKKNTILLSKDGSVGIAYKVEEDTRGITSGAILHLTVTDKEFLPDYLSLVINSIVVQLQAERDAGGSIIQHWKPDEIKQVVIPKLNDTIQIKISEKIQKSFLLKKQSEKLLEAAKKTVEIALEQDEETALNFLNRKIKSANG